VDRVIDNTKFVDNTLSLLSNCLGGSTSYKATGTWMSEDKGLVKEQVTICESYCETDKLETQIDDILVFCESLKKTLKQEAISLEVNNKLYFI